MREQRRINGKLYTKTNKYGWVAIDTFLSTNLNNDGSANKVNLSKPNSGVKYFEVKLSDVPEFEL